MRWLLCLPIVLFAADPFVEENNTFGVELYKEVAKEGGDLVISPFAISENFSTAYLGARGSTQTSMREVLRYPDKSAEKLAKTFAYLKHEAKPFESIGGIWFSPGQPILHSYQLLVGPAIHEPLFQTPSMTAVEINQWMSDRTGGEIRQLVSPAALGSMSKIVLASGALVSAPWLFPFKTAKAMHQIQLYPYMENDELELLAIPYTPETHLALIVMMPKGNLAEFEHQLTFEKIEEAIGQVEIKTVDVVIPSFQTSTRIYLREFLERLGMKIPFSKQADFSGIGGEKNIWITTAVHEARFDVQGGGSGVRGRKEVAYQGEAEVAFRADRPFFYILVDTRTGQYLLLGRWGQA